MRQVMRQAIGVVVVTVTVAGGGLTVTFTAADHRYEGTINAQNQVERVRT